MPALIALLLALVIGAFFVSRRAGMLMLAGASIAVAAMFAWTWHTGPGVELRRDAIPVAEIQILETRKRGNTTDYLVRNGSDSWTLMGLHTERIARDEAGQVVDRKAFQHIVEVPPGESSWQTLRFFGLDIGREYELEVVGTEGARPR